MDITKEIFTQHLPDQIPHIKKAESLLNIAEELTLSKVEKYKLLSESEVKAYYFDAGILVRSVDIGEVSSIEEFFEEIEDRIFERIGGDGEIQYWVNSEDYLILYTPSTQDIHIEMADPTEFAPMIKQYIDGQTLYSLRNVDQTVCISAQSDNEGNQIFFRNTELPDENCVLHEDLQQGDRCLFEGNIVHKYKIEVGENSDMTNQILFKTIEDDNFIFEGEAIGRVVLRGRYTFKHDRDFWIDVDSNIEDFEKNLEKLRKQNLTLKTTPVYEEPEIQMKITSPLFTYEGGTKKKVPHGRGKISINYSDKNFQKRA